MKALRAFILSPTLLVEYTKFEDLLGDFQDKIVTLVEAVETPIPGMPPYEAVKEPEGEAEMAVEGKFSWWRAVAIVFAIVACYVAVEKGYLPSQFLALIIVLSIVLMFLPQILGLVRRLLQRGGEEEEKARGMRLEDWVHETLAKMRKKYTSARFLIKVQNQTAERLPQYRALGVDEAMFNRSTYFKETLPHEFMSQIGEIEIACDKNCWIRRSLVISAIVQARQAAQHVQGVHPT